MSENQQQSGRAAYGKRVALGSDRYNSVLSHYYDEATMLDNMEFQAWGATLAQDLTYSVPIRHTRTMRDREADVVRSLQHYDDNYMSMMGRIMRFGGDSAFAEDPPSRIRRFVSNLQVFETDNENELNAVSYLLITRNRFDDDFFDLVPCERHDLLRESDGTFMLAKREVIVDQSVIGTPNLAMFL
ncbi:MAG: 3-phenylpropionate/cinnamic acid dioxygenase subunit beta [Arenicella sp.]|jgi:3-phenylpropionate/cinnamic acid dioxygenase small subunit|nr:3-phenylpropionate/cinnamic acid dioxygenase subunit beta [Arenicella sp.]